MQQLQRTYSSNSMRTASASLSQLNYTDVEKLLLLRSRGAANSVHDTASDTSSQQERKFANLIGGPDSGDRQEQEQYGVPANIGHRLYIYGCFKEKARQEKLREERERLLLQEMAQVTQRPNITNRARQKPAKGALFSDHAMLWERRKEENRRKMTKDAKRREFSQLSPTPAINPTSARLVEDRSDYKDPVNGWDDHFAKFCARRSPPLPVNLFSPNINSNATRPDTDLDIAERLFADSYQRRQRLREQAQKHIQQQLVDPATGRPYFTPQRLGLPSEGDSNRRPEEVFEALHENGKVTQEKKKQMVEQLDPEVTFTPKLNPRSSELSEKVRKPLYTPGGKLRGEGVIAEASPVSERPASTPINLQEFFRRVSRDDQIRQARMKALQDEYSSKDFSECTFHPRVNERSLEIFQETNMFGAPMANPGQAALPHREPTSVPRAPAATSPRTATTEKSLPTSARETPRVATLLKPTSTSDTTHAPSFSKHAAAPDDEYTSAFEKQMAAVLEEWRRLETV